MKKLIQTLKHIWAIDELRNKIVVTLALVLTYRLGTQITLPGIDPNKIEAASLLLKAMAYLAYLICLQVVHFLKHLF